MQIFPVVPMATFQMDLSADEEALIQKEEQQVGTTWRRPALLAAALGVAALGLAALHSGGFLTSNTEEFISEADIATQAFRCIKCDVKLANGGACTADGTKWLVCPPTLAYYSTKISACTTVNDCLAAAPAAPTVAAPTQAPAPALVPATGAAQNFRCIRCDKVVGLGACTVDGTTWLKCHPDTPWYTTKYSTCTNDCWGPAPAGAPVPGATVPAAVPTPGTLSPAAIPVTLPTTTAAPSTSKSTCSGAATAGTCASTGVFGGFSNMFSSKPTCGTGGFKDAECNKGDKCVCKAGKCYDNVKQTCV